MESQQVILSELSITELKALAHDQITERERINNNLQQIYGELNKKLDEEAAKAAEVGAELEPKKGKK